MKSKESRSQVKLTPISRRGLNGHGECSLVGYRLLMLLSSTLVKLSIKYRTYVRESTPSRTKSIEAAE